MPSPSRSNLRDGRRRQTLKGWRGKPSGGIVTHDWRYLFSKLGVLNHCGAIGWLTIQLGNLSMLFCLAGSAWLMWKMFASPKNSALRAG